MHLELGAPFAGQSVLVTGHTGFKGSWLSLWLASLGAKVHGFALAPDPGALFSEAEIEGVLASHVEADVRDEDALIAAVKAAAPTVVFHLAAQPLVRHSYRQPTETWATNVMGVVHLLEAVRACPSVKAVVVVTTDKCYENREWLWGYRETDPLGGFDPYSASKAGAELVVQSYRRSFFGAGVLLASARAGNVIGGGDWSADRLIPDAARSVKDGTALQVRAPASTRPWQHVLESLHGYLLLAERLLAGDRRLADAFNFGPDASDNRTVAEVLNGLQKSWPELKWDVTPATDAPHEAGFLYLDSSKAQRLLGWKPRWALPRALAETAHWYSEAQVDGRRARDLCEHQIRLFTTGQ